MPWKMTSYGLYYKFDGIITIPNAEDAQGQQRRELAAVTSQAFADCVYPPPKFSVTVPSPSVMSYPIPPVLLMGRFVELATGDACHE